MGSSFHCSQLVMVPLLFTVTYVIKLVFHTCDFWLFLWKNSTFFWKVPTFQFPWLTFNFFFFFKLLRIPELMWKLFLMDWFKQDLYFCFHFTWHGDNIKIFNNYIVWQQPIRKVTHHNLAETVTLWLLEPGESWGRLMQRETFGGLE